MRIEAGQVVELARGTGQSLRVTWTIEEGSAEVRGAALMVPAGVAASTPEWRQAREAMLARIEQGVADEEVSEAEAAALRSGDTSDLSEAQLALVRAFLGRDPIPVTVTNGAGQTLVETGGRNTRALQTVLCVEAIAGPDGCTLNVNEVEALLSSTTEEP